MELSSPVSMETCDCLQSSESDQGALVLGGGQFMLPKKSLCASHGWCRLCAWTAGT